MTLSLPLTGFTSQATFSNDGLYRYSLRRDWDGLKPSCLFALLNPSTADMFNDDPTVRRCTGYAKRWGYGSLEVVNLFGWRSTDPKILPKLDDPIGADNDTSIAEAVKRATLVVVAWGVHGGLRNRDRHVLALIRGLGAVPHSLRVTKEGFCEHPLYLPGTLRPAPYLGRPEVT